MLLKNAERNDTDPGRAPQKDTMDLAVFSAVHFLVDFCCIFLLTAFLLPLMADRFEWICCLVTYNLFAFAFQLPAGAFGDLYGRPKTLASAGCALIALAYGLLWLFLLSGLQSPQGDLVSISGMAPAPSGSVRSGMILFGTAVISGIGNAFFHVGGGIDTLRKCGGRAGRPGIFVSTGAFGVWLGPVLASRNAGMAAGTAAGILLMLFSSILLFALGSSDQPFCERVSSRKINLNDITNGREDQNTDIILMELDDTGIDSDGEEDHSAHERDTDCESGFQESDNEHENGRCSRRLLIAVFAAGCLFLTIVIRSYSGGLMGYTWKSVPLLAFLFTAGVSGGKMAGGLLGDRIGWMRSSAGSLLLALFLFCGAADHPLCGILAVFFFNMTMPVTLTAVSVLAGAGREGTAFGLTTFALFLGTLPSSVNILTETNLSPPWMLYVTTALSVLLICAGLAGMRCLLQVQVRDSEEYNKETQ